VVSRVGVADLVGGAQGLHGRRTLPCRILSGAVAIPPLAVDLDDFDDSDLRRRLAALVIKEVER
jgi:hypothetical protein